jgi:SAM-dependent methyltransferase
MNRLYDDLAWLWPMWGDPSTEYRSYCDHVGSLFKKYSKREILSFLNLGCGGGKNVSNLKREFDVTGLDISPAMIELAKQSNPECAFVQADMRSFTLEKRYDVILVDDAVAYITAEEDLRSLFKNAYEHLFPGGVMIAGPDDTTETFEQNKTSIWRSIHFPFHRYAHRVGLNPHISKGRKPRFEGTARKDLRLQEDRKKPLVYSHPPSVASHVPANLGMGRIHWHAYPTSHDFARGVACGLSVLLPHGCWGRGGMDGICVRFNAGRQ